MYAIYGNIYHQWINIPQMLAYIPYMDPMGIAMANETFINELVPQVTHHKIVILHVVRRVSQ